jgi:hypothetical protein
MIHPRDGSGSRAARCGRRYTARVAEGKASRGGGVSYLENGVGRVSNNHYVIAPISTLYFHHTPGVVSIVASLVI